MKGTIVKLLVAASISTGLVSSRAGAQTWVPQGPAPINTSASIREFSGCIESMLVDPTVRGRAFIGSVNGGVWLTTNLTATSPAWIPLTDQMGSLSIADVEFSPLDLNYNTLFVAIGDYSSHNYVGGPLIGILKSTDGGDSWVNLAQSTLGGRNIRKIVPTAFLASLQQVVLAAGDSAGIFRSTDGGSSFVLVSGSNALPLGGASDLVPDPTNMGRFYAAVPYNGVYRSDDAGATWSDITANLRSVTTTHEPWCHSCSVLANSDRIVLSVSPAGSEPVYAALIWHKGGGGTCDVATPFDIFRWDGSSWTAMGLTDTALDVDNGADGCRKLALLAHQTDPNVVFVAGDVNPDGSPSVWRGSVNSWISMTGMNANSTQPHADARSMVYDFNGQDILESSDGGIARLVNPDGIGSPQRQWESVNGNLQVTEFFGVSYDPLNGLLFGGTQDNGSPLQNIPGSLSYTDQTGGDGGGVGIDLTGVNNGNNSLALRYIQGGGCNITKIQRKGYDRNTNLVSIASVRLASPSTTNVPNSGLHTNSLGLITCGKYIVNQVAPSNMIISTGEGLFESTNQGDIINDITIPNSSSCTIWVYGGRAGTTVYPLFAWVSCSDGLYMRTSSGGSFVRQTAYPGSGVSAVQIDPWDLTQTYATDGTHVYRTVNNGVSWTDITGNLGSLSPEPGANNLQLQTIEVVERDDGISGHEVVLVGGYGGVYRTTNLGDSGGTIWSRFGANMPNSIVTSLHYFPSISTANGQRAEILVASTLGRGLWTMSDIRRLLFGACFTTMRCDPTDTWVDFNYTGTKTGCSDQPYNTLAEGIAHVNGQTLAIKSGATSAPPPINRPMTIEACGGTVTIGRHP